VISHAGVVRRLPADRPPSAVKVDRQSAPRVVVEKDGARAGINVG
jgi:hypothetical protein